MGRNESFLPGQSYGWLRDEVKNWVGVCRERRRASLLGVTLKADLGSNFEANESLIPESRLRARLIYLAVYTLLCYIYNHVSQSPEGSRCGTKIFDEVAPTRGITKSSSPLSHVVLRAFRFCR